MSVCLLGSCYYTQGNFSPISEISPKHAPLCSGRPRLQLLCSQDASADADQFSSGVKWGLLLRALLGTKPPDRGGGDGGSWRWVSQLLAIQTFTICLTVVIGIGIVKWVVAFYYKNTWYETFISLVIQLLCQANSKGLYNGIVYINIFAVDTFLHISQVGLHSWIEMMCTMHISMWQAHSAIATCEKLKPWKFQHMTLLLQFVPSGLTY